MKNINKYTKAELISKINGLKAKQIDSNSSLFTNLMSFLLLFKSFILKITLIALIIKVFKKFSIFRRIWSFFNLILFSIFGISMIDIYEVEILSNLLHNIIDIFSKIHSNILDLFGKKVEIPIELPTKMGSMKRIDQSPNGRKESNKIFERFGKIINNNQEEIQEVEEIKEDTPLYKNKYVIIGGILILSCLSWYFYDDLKPIGSSILAWINHFRPRPDPDSHGSNGSIQGNSKSNLSSLKDFVKEKIYGKDFSKSPSSQGNPIDLLDPNNKGKGRTLDFNNLTQTELERIGLLPQSTGLRDISGHNFVLESNAILSEIDTFNKYQENSSFPKIEVQQGFYNLIRERLLKLSQVSESKYNELNQDDLVYDKINKFIELESEIMDNLPDSPTSNTYNEIALATIEEQEVWSDKAMSPKSDLLSPILPLERLLEHRQERDHLILETIERKYGEIFDEDLSFKTGTIEFHNKQKEAPKVELKDWTHKFTIKEDSIEKDLINSIKGTFEEIVPLESDITGNKKDKHPEIIINKDSGSDSSMDHYFPKIENPKIEVKTEENKSTLSSVFDQIKTRRNDEDVTASPNIGNVGLQTPIQDRLNTSPLIHKPSLSNLFEDTMQLFDDDPTNIDISDKEQSNKQEFIQGSSKDQTQQVEVKPKTSINAIFDQIKSLRKEYGTPVKDNQELNEDQSSESSESNEEDPLDPWKDIKVNINNDEIHNRFVDIDFGELRNKAHKILIITNDGESNYFNPNLDGHNQKQTFKWDNKGISNIHYKDLEVTDIYVMEKYYKDGNVKFKNHEIFHKTPNKRISSYVESIKERYWD
jgi:hypothetical protein